MADVKDSAENTSEATASSGKSKLRSGTKTASKAATAVKSGTAQDSASTENKHDDMRKKELIDLVAAKGGMKRGLAKQGLEATLAVLADVLGDGKSFTAPPLGKVKVVREKETPNGKMAVVRIKFKSGEKAAPESSAEQSDD